MRKETPGILYRWMIAAREFREIALKPPQSVLDASKDMFAEGDIVGGAQNSSVPRIGVSRLTASANDSPKNGCARIQRDGVRDAYLDAGRRLNLRRLAFAYGRDDVRRL